MRTVKKTGDPVKTGNSVPTVTTSSSDTKSVVRNQGAVTHTYGDGTTAARAVNIVMKPKEEKKTPPTPQPEPKGESKTPSRRKPKPPKTKKPKSRSRRVKAQYGKGLGTRGNKTGRGGRTFSRRRTGRRGGKF